MPNRGKRWAQFLWVWYTWHWACYTHTLWQIKNNNHTSDDVQNCTLNRKLHRGNMLTVTCFRQVSLPEATGRWQQRHVLNTGHDSLNHKSRLLNISSYRMICSLGCLKKHLGNRSLQVTIVTIPYTYTDSEVTETCDPSTHSYKCGSPPPLYMYLRQLL